MQIMREIPERTLHFFVLIALGENTAYQPRPLRGSTRLVTRQSEGKL